MHITIVAGARPNFMKIAPVIHAIRLHNSQNKSLIEFKLVHTGQHYDKNMSGTFFEQLGIPKPDANLAAGGGSQAEQTSSIMTRFESYLKENPTDLVLVVGDVTSTLACSVVAKKMNVRVAHVEGGIRSGDWTMPEEINRVVTDSISDFFFTTSEAANRNLRKEGVDEKRVFLVGNTMIDSLLVNLEKLEKPDVWNQLGLKEGRYFLVTLHRPANVDETKKLKKLIEYIIDGAGGEPIIFPVHPRTRNALSDFTVPASALHFIEPLGYHQFIYLLKHARAVITDSGGVTEEATVLHIPCMTLRDNTERPETVTVGTNELIGTDPEAIIPALKHLRSGKWKQGDIPEMWDGRSASRIVDILLSLEKQGLLQKPRPYVDTPLIFQQ